MSGSYQKVLKNKLKEAHAALTRMSGVRQKLSGRVEGFIGKMNTVAGSHVAGLKEHERHINIHGDCIRGLQARLAEAEARLNALERAATGPPDDLASAFLSSGDSDNDGLSV